MTSDKRCSECGAIVPEGSPGGLCGQCLLGLGLQQEQEPLETSLPTAAPERTPQPKPQMIQSGDTQASGGSGAIVVAPQLTEKPGDKIGRYKLLQQIGEGGFGVVYMAQQQEPVRRRAALKIIKLGMDTRQVVARFEAERQALALMDHPNIAKILDAGATETGRPYFVMELVKGIRITDYCDQNRLPLGGRLELFVQICHAVQHAHQKGIIHRDLKPSNILVTLHDGVPVPKIIDFGIAKATQAELTEQTVFTQFGQFIGTPAYMSPEQAEMSGLDVDTRSDIYSLGVLLYELLTGATPFDTKDLLGAGLEGMRRILREQEPLRPSTRLTQELEAANMRKPSWSVEATGKEDSKASAQRLLQLKERIRLLRGDLDWIAMKCLEKDRTRRYDSVGSFARDVEQFLNNQPVNARPPSKLYRFQKLVRRNKVTFAAAGAVTAALVIGLGVSWWMFLREKAAFQRFVTAERKARFEERLRQQVVKMLKGAGPAKAAGRDTTLLREILDETAKSVGFELKDQPEVEAEMRNTLGEVYLELGEYQKADIMLREALEMRRNLFGKEHLDVANSLQGLAAALAHQGHYTEAVARSTDALQMRRKLLGPEHAQVASSLYFRAEELREQGKWTEAAATHRQALAMRRKLLGDHPDTAISLLGLAFTLYKMGNAVEAETLSREALAMQQALLGSENPETAKALNYLALALWRQNKLAEAATMMQKALELRRTVLGTDHPELGGYLNNLCLLLQAQGKPAEAEPMLREALRLQRKISPENPDVARSLSSLGALLADEGKFADAETMQREALAMRRKIYGLEHQDVAYSLYLLGDHLLQQGKFAEAEQAERDALEMRRKLQGRENPEVGESLSELAEVFRQEGRLVEAKTMQEDALAMLRKLLGQDHSDVAGSLQSLGRVLADEGRLTEAQSLQEQALKILHNALGNEHPYVAEVLADLAGVLALQGKPSQAEIPCRQALEMRRKLLGNGHPSTAASLDALARLMRDQAKLVEAQELVRQRQTFSDAHPDDWQTFSARSLAGSVLLLQKKYAEAEPLLLSGYEGMEQRKERMPAAEKSHIKEVIRCLAQLYEATGRADQAAQWRQKLTQSGPAVEGKQ